MSMAKAGSCRLMNLIRDRVEPVGRSRNKPASKLWPKRTKRLLLVSLIFADKDFTCQRAIEVHTDSEQDIFRFGERSPAGLSGPKDMVTAPRAQNPRTISPIV